MSNAQQVLRWVFFVAGWVTLASAAVDKPWGEFFLIMGAGSILYLGESVADAIYYYLKG